MKVLGIIGVVVSVIALILGAYLQFAIVPAAEMAETSETIAYTTMGEAYYGSPQQALDFAARDAKTSIGEIVLLIGGLALLLSIVPAIKKINIAWLGVGLGVATTLLGAAYGTHMFS